MRHKHRNIVPGIEHRLVAAELTRMLTHDLANLAPDDPWFTDLELLNLDVAAQAGVGVTPNYGSS